MLSAMLETASIAKRSYSDRSVRGYITEVNIKESHYYLKVSVPFKMKIVSSKEAGK